MLPVVQQSVSKVGKPVNFVSGESMSTMLVYEEWEREWTLMLKRDNPSRGPSDRWWNCSVCADRYTWVCRLGGLCRYSARRLVEEWLPVMGTSSKVIVNLVCFFQFTFLAIVSFSLTDHLFIQTKFAESDERLWGTHLQKSVGRKREKRVIQ